MCGIATFAGDLAESIRKQSGGVSVEAIALNDSPRSDYCDSVVHNFDALDRAAYPKAAKWINGGNYDVLSVQHEYGIFGGESGNYLLDCVREVRLPIVTTFHTVRPEPTFGQFQVLCELIKHSSKVAVMSQKAVDLLMQVHHVPESKITLIPHGIPSIRPEGRDRQREGLGVTGPMILTFGLLSRDKGIQYMIEAMKDIIVEHPDAQYIVLGATHPNVKASEGEVYREFLIALAEDIGVANNVRFIDHFVPLEELTRFLSAMDFYVTPYLNSEQITSGTLAYSLGAGKVVISTPYWYAQEILAEERGIVVPFRDAAALSCAILDSLASPESQVEMGTRAARYGEQMQWSEVGRRYVETFDEVHVAHHQRRSRILETQTVPVRSLFSLPEFNLAHLQKLSDDTGIFQHATFSCPNRHEGYCVDDNARALIFSALMDDLGESVPELQALQVRYLSFVYHAFDPVSGKFRNFMGFGRGWLERTGSDDSQGRSLWSLGVTASRSSDPNHRALAANLFEAASGSVVDSPHLRTAAYSILGAVEYLSVRQEDTVVRALLVSLAEKLTAALDAHGSANRPWFERELTYANARLPQALMLAGECLGDGSIRAQGLRSLEWLMEFQTAPSGGFAPMGAQSAPGDSGERSFYDQQPIEACASVSACLTAARITQDRAWVTRARSAFDWFLGDNMLGKPLYVPQTGACHDGLHPTRLNMNQGAESSLSFLIALAEMRKHVAVGLTAATIALR